MYFTLTSATLTIAAADLQVEVENGNLIFTLNTVPEKPHGDAVDLPCTLYPIPTKYHTRANGYGFVQVRVRVSQVRRVNTGLAGSAV